jgi:predicted O-methyltransferase YrrM
MVRVRGDQRGVDIDDRPATARLGRPAGGAVHPPIAGAVTYARVSSPVEVTVAEAMSITTKDRVMLAAVAAGVRPVRRLQDGRCWFRRRLGRWRWIGLIREVRRLKAEASAAGEHLAQTLLTSIGRPLADELPWIERIEAERARIETSHRQVGWKAGKPASVAMIARRGSVPKRDGVFLLKLVRAYGPSRGLELGTCVGVSAAYQGSGMQLNGSGELITLEGYRDLADQARELWRDVCLDNVIVVSGRFQHSLPAVLESGRVDYAFVDGNHQEAATIEYFEQIAARANPGAVLVFDDIYWSPGMLRAWEQIRRDPRIAAHAAISRFGVVVFSRTVA